MPMEWTTCGRNFEGYIGWVDGMQVVQLRFRTNGISRLCTMYSHSQFALTFNPLTSKTFLGLWQTYAEHTYGDGERDR